jgi:hypothetical protein
MIASATESVSNRFSAYVSTWKNMSVDDVGEPADVAGIAERSVQVEGEFDGASVVIEGSNDGINYHALNSRLGIGLSIGLAGLEAIDEAVRFIRPRISDGAAGTMITVSLFMRGGK